MMIDVCAGCRTAGRRYTGRPTGITAMCYKCCSTLPSIHTFATRCTAELTTSSSVLSFALFAGLF